MRPDRVRGVRLSTVLSLCLLATALHATSARAVTDPRHPIAPADGPGDPIWTVGDPNDGGGGRPVDGIDDNPLPSLPVLVSWWQAEVAVGFRVMLPWSAPSIAAPLASPVRARIGVVRTGRAAR